MIFTFLKQLSIISDRGKNPMRRFFHGKAENQAASDNVTHGTWIIVAVALAALIVGSLAIPGSPVQSWLLRIAHSIGSISATSTASTIATVPINSGDSGPYSGISVGSSSNTTYQGTAVQAFTPTSSSGGMLSAYEYPSGTLQPDTSGNYTITITFSAASSSDQTYGFEYETEGGNQPTASGPNPGPSDFAPDYSYDNVPLTPTLTRYTLSYTVSGDTANADFTNYSEIYLTAVNSSDESTTSDTGTLYIAPAVVSVTPS